MDRDRPAAAAIVLACLVCALGVIAVVALFATGWVQINQP
jgi:hypothetical protein